MRERPSRRDVLGTLGCLGLVGVTGRVAGQTQTGESILDEWLSNTSNYDGRIRDVRNESSLAVLVGAQGNGGAFAFRPPAIRISPGTTVVWIWSGEGGQHSVVAESGADFSSGLRSERGARFRRQFGRGAGAGQASSQRVITYYCQPHRSLGMKGGIIVDWSSSATTPSPSPTTTEQQSTRSPTAGEQTDGQTEPSSPGSNWPQFQYGPANTGAVPDATLPAPGVREAWRFQTRDRVESAPTAVGGAVYAMDRSGVVYALDAADGTERWRRRVGSSAEGSSLVVVDGTVYGGVAGRLVAFDAASGNEVWTSNVGRPVESTPAVVDGTVYVGSLEGAVYAFDAANGSQEWRVSTRGSVRSSPAVVNGRVYVGSNDSRLYALDASSGTPVWELETRGGVAASPAVVDDTAYVTEFDGFVSAVDAASGRRRWRTDVGNVTESSPAVVDDTVLVSDSERLYALSADDGSRRWRSDGGSGSLSPVVADGVVSAADWRGVIYGRSISDGSERWRFHAGSRPALAAGRDHLYAGCGSFGEVGGDSGWIVALESDPEQSVGAMGVRVPGTDLHLDERNAGVGAVAILTASAVGTKTINGIRRGLGGGSSDTDTESEPSGDPDTESEPTPEFDPAILDIAGVDESTAQRLAAAGYDTPSAVADATEDDLTTIDGISAPLAARIIADLQNVRTDGIDERDTDTRQSTGQSTSVTNADSGGEPASGSDTDTTTRQFDSVETPAGQFAANCDAFEGARVVSTEGAVHVYDGQFVDSRGESDACIYALAPAHAGDETAEAAFRDAVRAWRGISKNTHVATVYDSDDDPRPWVAFDRGRGPVENHRQTLDREQRIDVVLGLTEAIRTAGMYNVRHGALTPAVVFLVDDDTNGQIATLADWGLQGAVHEAVAGQIPPTPYTAPEQLDGDDRGTATDIYRLGAVTYWLLTGEQPFADAADLETAIREGNPKRPTEHDSSLPTAIDDIVADAMARDPDERPDSPYDIHQLLAAID